MRVRRETGSLCAICHSQSNHATYTILSMQHLPVMSGWRSTRPERLPPCSKLWQRRSTWRRSQRRRQCGKRCWILPSSLSRCV